MTVKPPDSTERLKAALLELPESQDRDLILQRAAANIYHDFKSDFPAPKRLLVKHLRDAGLNALASRVIEGEFDQTKEEADEWSKTPEGKETLQAIGLLDEDKD